MMGVMWGHGFRCKECGIVHSSSLINSADKEKLHKLRAEYVHVWSEVEGGVAGRGNAGRQLMEQVMSVANSVASVTEGPVRDVLGAVKTWSMPKYWVPDGEIFECSACSKEFEHGGKKHHCRACGHGFCDRCTQHRAAVPDRGWMTPVRVCAGCNAKMAAAEGTGAGSGAVGYGERRPTHAQNTVMGYLCVRRWDAARVMYLLAIFEAALTRQCCFVDSLEAAAVPCRPCCDSFGRVAQGAWSVGTTKTMTGGSLPSRRVRSRLTSSARNNSQLYTSPSPGWTVSHSFTAMHHHWCHSFPTHRDGR